MLTPFSALNITVNTTLTLLPGSYTWKPSKLIGEAMHFFLIKLLSHEIFSSIVFWTTIIFEKFEKPSATPSPLAHA